MNFVWRNPFFRDVQNPTTVFAFWRCLQQPFSTTIIYDKDPSSSSSSWASSVDYPSSEMVDYLRKSCGLPSKAAAGICRKLGSRGSVEKARTVIDFLKESGFADTHIRKTITTSPALLVAGLERTVRPKVRAFLDWGLSGHDVGQIISTNHRILKTSLQKIAPIVAELRNSLPDDEKAVMSMKHFFFCSFLGHGVEKRIRTNLSTLRSLGVTERSLSTLLAHWSTLLGMKPRALEMLAEKVNELGIDQGSLMFPYALFAVSSMKESVWDAKLEVLKGFGWTQENIIVAFRKYPIFLTISASNLKKKMEFFVEGLGYTPSELATIPTLLLFSLEKRIKPRLAVIRMLDSKKLLKKKNGLFTILTIKNEAFYKQYVLQHIDEFPDILEAYGSKTKDDADVKSDDSDHSQIARSDS